ncbi:MAG: hypothetical protein ACOC1P_05445 [Minisyncoccales bacterium]
MKKKEKKELSESDLRQILALLIVLIVILVSVFFVAEANGFFYKGCGDGTPYLECSSDKPYFCNEQGVLVKKADVCGCPEIMNYTEGICYTSYESGEIFRSFDYYVHGEKGEIEMFVFKGIADNLSDIPRSYDFGNLTPSRREVKLDIIDNELQEVYLKDLVKKIQNIDSDKVEQARIAISLVQRIPYGFSDKKTKIQDIGFFHSRYPYEVLYENEGVCGEKSELLIFLLREIGFGTAIFHFPEDNHEAVGIRCPVSESYDNTGYCFVETTASSILSSQKNNYISSVELSTWPRMIFISHGDSLPKGLDEYQDSEAWISLRKRQIQEGELNFFRYYRKKGLEEKYGLNGHGL